MSFPVAEDKITQIIPADGWFVAFEEEATAAGTSRPGKPPLPTRNHEASRPRPPGGRLVAFGLRADGVVVPLIADDHGAIVDASVAPGFRFIYHRATT